MKQVNRHIISSLNWSTTFDSKEKATELQSRLSTWSNVRLLRELNDLFDKMCPPGQTWRIGSLELDLGDIEYDQLESELSLRVRKQLMQKLEDMIRYPEKNAGTEFEILDADASRLDLIESFLLTGTIPWNGSLEQESADRLMMHQLKNNKAAVIEMLWEVGSGREYVRRRMAWQFSDATVIRIIEGLEPGNHQSIVDFADDVTALQRKEPVVQGSADELRKNIWHWVLNYLYNEHGTVFNRIAFMKSTIRQMAAHHNVSYEELMVLIEEAVNHIKKKTGTLSDFVHTLDLLSEERKAERQNESTASEQHIDYWLRLEAFLRDPALRDSSAHRAEFNDLVVNLGRRNKQRLADSVRHLLHEKNLRVSAVADLQEFSLEVMFAALLSASSAALLGSMNFLQTIGREANLWRESKVLWNAALKFAIENRSAASDPEVFMAYCIREIAAETGTTADDIFNCLLTVRVPSALKTAPALEIYSSLIALAEKQEGSGTQRTPATHFTELLDALCAQTTEVSSDRKTLLALRASFMRKVKLYPEAALQALIAYPRKSELNSILPFITSPAIAELLLRNSSSEMQQLMKSVQQTARAAAGESNTAVPAELLKQYVQVWAVEAMVLHSATDAAAVLEYVLAELAEELTDRHSEQFVFFCTALMAHENSAVKTAAEKALRHFTTAHALRYAVQIKQLMLRKGDNRRRVAKLLKTRFTTSDFIAWRTAGNKEGAEVLHFLLPEGDKWMQKFVTGYTSVLLPQVHVEEREVMARLREIFWKCVVEYEAHQGSLSRFRKSFRAAVQYAFARANEEIVLPENEISATEKQTASAKKKSTKASAGAVTEKAYILSGGEVVTLRELFELIAEGLESSSATINRSGTHYELKELLELALELKPEGVRKIIAATALTEPRLRMLKDVISFSQLSMWILSDQRGEINSAMEAMRMLHDLIAVVVPGAATERFLDAFWREAWTVIGAGKWSRDELKKLIRTSFTKMAAELNVNAATFITEMKSRNVRITPFLRDNLVACFPAFAALPERTREASAARRLSAFETSGVLDSIVEHIVLHKRIPLWLGDSASEEVSALLQEIIIHYPVKFLQVIKREPVSETQMRWLSETISFKELIVSIGDLNKERHATLYMLEEFYTAIGKMTVSGVSVRTLQEILFRKLIKAWAGNNWKIVAVENILNELVWDVSLKYSVPKKTFLRDLQRSAALFSPAVKIALDSMTGSEPAGKIASAAKPAHKKKKTIGDKVPYLKDTPTGVAVRNAGVVLLSSYVQMLFERLGVARHGKFISPQAQNDAVHFLQYVVTGHTSTEESFLPLNKLMCGLPLSHPVTDGITINDDQKKLIDSLIKAAIAHWPTIGDTSINGFRGNWLVRDGMLYEYDDKWSLVVEKRAYDLLLSKSPYSFSIIRYPWMDKSLHATWPY